ncbi:MAG: DNA-3-methyladenine glycosylase 2 family protein, partial [Proteobacteria bacterium]|nr:DNA-3-methyladenine glycosylase 2 family protein [Pseudomonadota bacterium]
FGAALPEPVFGGDDVTLTHGFPNAHRLRDADFTLIGVPAKRAAALRGLAAAVDDGVIDFSHAPVELVRRLQELPGIGEWTAQYIVMRALRDPDALPFGDLVLRKMLGGERAMAPRAVEQHAEAWRPWRAYGLIHLWAMATEKSRGKRERKTNLEHDKAGE